MELRSNLALVLRLPFLVLLGFSRNRSSKTKSAPIKYYGVVIPSASKPSLNSGLPRLTTEAAGALAMTVAAAQPPQAEEISGKLQQIPAAQWNKEQKPSMRETEGGVT